MTAKNLLVELFVEELPPKALKKIGQAFVQGIEASLKAQGLLAADSVSTGFASPRRLGVHLTNVAAQAADKPVAQKLMPVAVGIGADGKATPALLKKLAALGADESAVPNLKRENDGKADVLFFNSVVKGASLAEGLQKAIEESLSKLPIPKVMTYQLADGWDTVNFVRPAHGLVALHGNEIVSVAVLGLTASNTTHGHRFEASVDPVVIKNADSYADQLRSEGAVIAGFAERRAEIVRQLTAAAAKAGANLTPIEDEALLDEVTGLVERPNVLIGQFEEAFLEVPQECLILTMKANQKYFPLLSSDGKLSNKFLIVSNINPADASAVIGGNERVVRPRLADAKFFFDQDRKKTLASRVDGLAKVVYHNKLGTQGERIERVRAIARAIATKLGVDVKQADQAAQLAKADLLTDMVGEFPELQGIMGRYYAQHHDSDAAVADAIEDHYKPRFAGDELPRNDVGVVVALADKLETLVGLFGIGQLPTGDKDPFALRRHSLGIVRLLSEKDLKLGYDELILLAVRSFPEGLLTSSFDEKGLSVPLSAKIGFFVEERAANYLKDLGYTPQEAEAVISLPQAKPSDYIPRLEAIRKAKNQFSDNFDSLAASDKRARNILTKSGAISEIGMTDSDTLVEPAEKILLAKTRELREAVNDLVAIGDFEKALLLTVEVSAPVAAFFADVMVNAQDEKLRTHRFRLLHEVVGLTNCVANLSKLAS